mgnify:CR=1 FL=1
MSQTAARPAFDYAALFTAAGLQRLDDEFLTRLAARYPDHHARLLTLRATGSLPAIELSDTLLACAPLVEDIIATYFGITAEVGHRRAATLAHDPVFQFKKMIVQRRARRRLMQDENLEAFALLDAAIARALHQYHIEPDDRELGVARLAVKYLADADANKDALETLTRWCVQAIKTAEGRAAVKGWVSFQLPTPRDHARLVPIVPVPNDPAGRVEGPPAHRRRRDGFALTDERMGARAVQSEVNYCIYCHDHDGDFCSKGFPEKKGEPDKGLRKDPLGVILTGCPLDEKISEMHLLKRDGYVIAPLAMIMADNPMCPATGHRICNDCMKGCIYQKQEPVNIPQIETGALTDVLALPWGVEIYDLLTRWNPLRARQWLPKPYNGLKALVLGMGPAGFTLAHHLTMEGFGVIGIEGLKIEPLPDEIVRGPIRDYARIEEALDDRVMAGFGGVAEYGITNRWDKNFLKLIYLTLARRPRFQVFGGVRFGGTVTIEDAWHCGFDHVAITVGAGLPQALPIPGSLAPGMRQANDFLMALQLTGAAKQSSLANLQLRMPAVVIGGGLTGVDTATEAQAYYIVQVEKMLTRFEQLARATSEDEVRKGLSAPDRKILDEFLDHGRQARAERARATRAGELPDFARLIRSWGGVTIAYRKGMNDSPAYTRNHEEIVKALEEGIYYAEGLEPKFARLDADGQIEALVCEGMVKDDAGHWTASGEEVVIPARAVLVATGARPNVAYEFEHKGHFAKERGHYQTHRDIAGKLEPIPVAPHCKSPDFGAFTSYHVHDRRVSYLGDTHPVFHGSVVKAIASGARTWPKIVESFGARMTVIGDDSEYARWREKMRAQLEARVHAIRRLTADVIELTVHAPAAARHFAPGQFFRVQNFETRAVRVHGVCLQTEALAMTGARVDREQGLVTLVIIERGASSRMLATLQPGDPIALMGPTGVKTTIPHGKTVAIVGGRHGCAHVQATGSAMRAAGNRVLFIACLDSREALFHQEHIENAADAVLWITRQGKPINPRRIQDRAASGELLDVIVRYARGDLETGGGTAPIALEDADRLMVVGSNTLVRLIRDARTKELAPFLRKKPATVASISTPMQCMLKGVCSQCLQWQIDPHTGQRTKAVFGCSWQDEPLDIVDLDNLDERLSQNRVQEHLTNRWLEYLLSRSDVSRV